MLSLLTLGPRTNPIHCLAWTSTHLVVVHCGGWLQRVWIRTIYCILLELGIMSRILRGPPSRPSDESTNFRLSDKWWSVCTRCWILEPSARPAMNDIVAEIEGQNESGGGE